MGTTNRLSRRIGTHFALCAAATASHLASADVNYWPDANLVVPATIDGLYINVETRTTGSSGASTAGWDLNPYSSSSLTWFNATGTGMLRFPGATTGSAGSLDLNTPVAATGSYGSGAVTVGSAPGNWRLNADNYFGFRFTASDGLTHYGWGKFAIGSSISGGDRTITELAWETLPNTPIDVGNTGGPPPAYDPCAPFNPTAGVGTSTLGYRSDESVADLSACGATIHRANFYRFTAVDAGSYTFETCPTSGAARMALLSACSGGSVLSCGSPACGSGASITTNLDAGSTVWVVIGGETADAGLGTSVPLVVTAPPIGICVNAASATYGDNAIDSTQSLATTQNVFNNAAQSAQDTIFKPQWFRFTPTATGDFAFKTCLSGDTKLAIGTACPSLGGVFTTIAYNDDAPTCFISGTSANSWGSWIDATNNGATGLGAGFPLTQQLVAGQTYYICVGGFASTTVVAGSLNISGPEGATCQADLNDDGFVNGDDLGILLSQWGECTTSCSADFNNDGFVNGDDLGVLLAAWGACP